MEVRLSFASMNDIVDAIDDLKRQAVRQEEPSVELFLDDSSGFANGGDETLRLTFVDEGNDEFANPSAVVSRS